MIIGDPDVRIVHDETRSSLSMQSNTNFSYSTNPSQYDGFMKPEQPNQNEPEKKLKIKVEVVNFVRKNQNENENEQKLSTDADDDDDGVDGDINDESTTVTYNNSNEDYHILHGIKAVGCRSSLVKQESIQIEEKDESEGFRQHNQRLTPAVAVKKKISEYKKSCKSLEESSAEKRRVQRRESVRALQVNRVVKSKRGVFEINNVKK